MFSSLISPYTMVCFVRDLPEKCQRRVCPNVILPNRLNGVRRAASLKLRSIPQRQGLRVRILLWTLSVTESNRLIAKDSSRLTRDDERDSEGKRSRVLYGSGVPA